METRKGKRKAELRGDTLRSALKKARVALESSGEEIEAEPSFIYWNQEDSSRENLEVEEVSSEFESKSQNRKKSA